ncbi:Lipase (class 3) [Pseudomonas prosekii]|uniref:Lipase (Class 3) n=2 Tax=Pseudomonas prosekii TaxID=1148509 RepID=A0A1H1WJ45_9PSED|nr:Lipase (class 3) [Pseudomonas prosekii]
MKPNSISEHDKPFMGGDIHACPKRGHSTSFQLVDEFGDGKPYAGLAYEVVDYEDTVHTGRLDSTGFGKVDNHYRGALILKINREYKGGEQTYSLLQERHHYPLPITELQVRAEKTRFFDKSGARTQNSHAKEPTDFYCQVEVSELVEQVAHLPPLSKRNFEPANHVLFMMRQQSTCARGESGTDLKTARRFGVGLLPNRHHVLEVRPLRSLRPVLSTANEFCALNLYQLALMSTLSYTRFGQDPDEQPVSSMKVTFPTQPTSGNWFGDALATGEEIWQVDAGQNTETPFYPLYEDVPYSKRLEIIPFNPEYYPRANAHGLGDEQENPANVHSLDDSKEKGGTDTQAIITHHDELILIAVRGTNDHPWDLLRDIDAHQVPFAEGVGQAHRGFYEAAKVAYRFATKYLDKFHSNQKLIITGHSLGGAIALLLVEMLRRRPGFSYDILLYTYGAPRAADQTFVDGASALTHHRMVNHNDPIPSVPGTQMDTKPAVMGAGLAVGFANAPLGVSMFFAGVINLSGEAFAHHGELHHFMPVRFENGDQASILWQPGCESINQRACNELLQQKNGLPKHRAFEPSVYILNHLMVGGYIPNSWATLRRWQESHEYKRPIVTSREFKWVSDAIQSMINQLEKSSRETRPDAYRRAHQGAIDAIIAEKGNLQVTRDRLATLRKVASSANVYGHLATNPQLLADTLNRWKANLANTAAEQLASTPPAVEDNDQVIAALTGGHAVGTPFHLDIDSIM